MYQEPVVCQKDCCSGSTVKVVEKIADDNDLVVKYGKRDNSFGTLNNSFHDTMSEDYIETWEDVAKTNSEIDLANTVDTEDEILLGGKEAVKNEQLPSVFHEEHPFYKKPLNLSWRALKSIEIFFHCVRKYMNKLDGPPDSRNSERWGKRISRSFPDESSDDDDMLPPSPPFETPFKILPSKVSWPVGNCPIPRTRRDHVADTAKRGAATCF